jgi:PilZ domain
MTTPYNGPERRRSMRLVYDVGLNIRGSAPGRAPFNESTFTISVSAHGALVLLAATVDVGQTVFLRKPLVGNEIEGKVTRIGGLHGGVRLIAVDFLEPSDHFWSFKDKE